MLQLKCYDVSNSYRLYDGEKVRALKRRCHHFDIVEEFLVKLSALYPSLRIKEVLHKYEKRKAGKTKRRLFLFALGYIKLWPGVAAKHQAKPGRP